MQSGGSLIVRAGATFAVLAIAFAAIAVFIVAPLVEANPQAGVVVPVGVAVTLAAGAAIALRATREDQGAVEGVLVKLSPWLPGALGLTIITLFLLGQSAAYATGVALVTTAVAWLAIGFLFSQYARVDNAQPRNYAELSDRWTRLQADESAAQAYVDALTDGEKQNGAAAQREVASYVQAIGRDLGVLQGTTPAAGRSYALGTGYIDLWNRIHRAEEALIDLAPAANVIASARHDELRLKGSAVGHATELSTVLREAIEILRKPPEGNGAQRAEARRMLRSIRRDINQFRDGVWDQMLDQRHMLLTRMLFTGVVADIVLVVALIVGADQTVILGAAVFYLVGALIGLFARLQADTSTASTVDDYGLANARLMVTPVISGIAAVAGVVLTARLLLPASDVLAPPTVESDGKLTSFSGEVRQPAELNEVFDLELNVGGILVAAIFGLTPGLVLDRLKSEAEKYKSDLQNSTAADGKKTA